MKKEREGKGGGKGYFSQDIMGPVTLYICFRGCKSLFENLWEARQMEM